MLIRVLRYLSQRYATHLAPISTAGSANILSSATRSSNRLEACVGTFSYKVDHLVSLATYSTRDIAELTRKLTGEADRRMRAYHADP